MSPSLAAAIGGLLCLATKLGPFHVGGAETSGSAPSRLSLDQPEGPARLCGLPLPHVGALRHVGVDRSGTRPCRSAHRWRKTRRWSSGGCLPSARLRQEAQPASSQACFADRLGKENHCPLGLDLQRQRGAGDRRYIRRPAVDHDDLRACLGSCHPAGFGAVLRPRRRPFATEEMTGSLMTFQTALGFALTFFTVQATPVLAAAIGWPGRLRDHGHWAGLRHCCHAPPPGAGLTNPPGASVSAFDPATAFPRRRNACRLPVHSDRAPSHGHSAHGLAHARRVPDRPPSSWP